MEINERKTAGLATVKVSATDTATHPHYPLLELWNCQSRKLLLFYKSLVVRHVGNFEGEENSTQCIHSILTNEMGIMSVANWSVKELVIMGTAQNFDHHLIF